MNMWLEILKKPKMNRVLGYNLRIKNSQSMSKKKLWWFVRRARRFKKDLLEGLEPEFHVKLNLDWYRTTVFWYLALHRPIIFKDKHAAFSSNKTWCLYDILQDKKKTEKLNESNLGIYYVKKEDVIVFHWRRAREHGIFENIETTVAWQKVYDKYKKDLKKELNRTPEDTGGEDWYMYRCARDFSFVYFREQLKDIVPIEKYLYHWRPRPTYTDILGLAVVGADIPHLDIDNTGTIDKEDLSKLTKYVSFSPLPIHKEEASAIFQSQKLENKLPLKLRSKITKKEQRKNNHYWYLASRVIGRLPRYIGTSCQGRLPTFISSIKSNELYENVFTAYIRGKCIDTNWSMLESELKKLKLYIELGKERGETIPECFEKWLRWSNEGKFIEEDIEKMRVGEQHED